MEESVKSFEDLIIVNLHTGTAEVKLAEYYYDGDQVSEKFIKESEFFSSLVDKNRQTENAYN